MRRIADALASSVDADAAEHNSGHTERRELLERAGAGRIRTDDRIDIDLNRSTSRRGIARACGGREPHPKKDAFPRTTGRA